MPWEGVKRTKLKDESLLIDMSEVKIPKGFGKVGFMELMEGERLEKVKAISMCGLKLLDLTMNPNLSRSLVILNLSNT